MADELCSLSVSFPRSWQTGSLTVFRVMIDGLEVGRLRAGEDLRLALTPGSHTVGLRQTWTGLTGRLLAPLLTSVVQAAPGEHIELRLGLTKVGLPRLNVVDPPSDPAPVVARSEPTSQPVDPGPMATTPRPTATEIVEGERFEVALGTPEARLIDNSDGVSDVVRTFRLSRSWTRTLTADTEVALRACAGLGIPWVQLKAEIEATLTRHRSTALQEQQVFEDTVVVTAAARTRTTVYFAWKEIRQAGVVKVLADGVAVTEVPFERVVGLSFDQRQVDEQPRAGRAG